MPGDTPVTTPFVPIVAILVLNEDHAPPEGVPVNAGVFDPIQTEVEPPFIAVGPVLPTSIYVEAAHPPIVSVYDITMPVPTVLFEVNIPVEELIVPEVVGDADHTPPPVASVNAGVAVSVQILLAPPAIAAGCTLMVTVSGVDVPHALE